MRAETVDRRVVAGKPRRKVCEVFAQKKREVERLIFGASGVVFPAIKSRCVSDLVAKKRDFSATRWPITDRVSWGKVF